MKSLRTMLIRPGRGQKEPNVPKGDAGSSCNSTHSGSVAPCPYNPCLTFDFDLDLDTHRALFHQKCTICKPVNPESEILCPSCQHLSLRHLLLCVKQMQWFYIVLGTIAEITSRPECPLCRIIAQMIQRNRKQAEETWQADIRDDNECILGQAHRKEESNNSSLYFQIFFFGREALKRCRGTVKTRYHLQFRFRDLQIQLPTRWDPDETPDPLYTSAVVEFGFGKLSQFQPVSTVGPQVQWTRVLDLVRSCQSHKHGTFQESPQVFTGPHRIVDVKKRCVVRTPAGCRYITLSYVWGSPAAKKIRLTKANIELWEKEGSLLDEVLALTISDAMQVCTKLGERYLWVDTLCIVQDDAEEKAQEIRLMGEIYKFSYLTIVAAAGNDAEAGLPGVSRAPRSMSQLAVSFCGLEAVEVLPSFEAVVTRSIWNTRAWTYQERILSGRTLYFTDCQVFYNCDSGVRYEDMCGDQYLDEYDGAAFRTHSWTEWHPWLQFHHRVGEYSTRNLSYDSDIFNAFAGVAHAVYQHRVDHYFGLPECNFDEALLWQPTGPYQPRAIPSGTVIPSWSWGSHKGPVRFSLSSHSNFAGSLIRFYVWSDQASSLVSLYPAPYWHDPWPLPLSSESTSEYPHHRALYLAIAWKQGCATSTIENNLTGEQLKSLFQERISRQCGPLGDVTPLSQSLERLDPEGFEGFPSSARKAACCPGTLLFKAPVAEFSLFDHSASNEPYGVFEAVTDSVTVLTIITPRGLHAGFIEMDRAWAKRNLHSSLLHGRFNFIALSIGRYESGGNWDVERQVALSIPSSNYTWFPPKDTLHLQSLGDIGYTADKQTDTRYFDRLRHRLTTPVVHVMLTKQHLDQHADVVVSTRLGVGWVFLGRWCQAEPQLKTIILR